MMATDHAEEVSGTMVKRVGFWLGLALFTALLVLPAPTSMRRTAAELDHAQGTSRGTVEAVGDGQTVDIRARRMMAAAAVTALVACWWITVAVPIPVTSLLPLALFPLVGVMPIQAAAAPYADPNVFLFMGGFIIALAIERWNLHRRMALHIVGVFGGSRATIVLGFMAATAFISLWISNTATTLMMLPIGLAVITAMADLGHGADPRHKDFAAALMLGIAYAASIGGMGTPIGTPPNIVFQGIYSTLFPGAPAIGFSQWMLMYVPLVVVFVPVTWLVLTRVTGRVERAPLPLAGDVIREQIRQLQPMGRPERIVLIVFVSTAALWMTRSIPVASTDYGWAALIERLLASPTSLFRAEHVHDATVALVMAALLFVIPAGRDAVTGRREHLMDWETAQRLPWGVLLLFGGGFAIAAGFQTSGLSHWCGTVFAEVGITSPLLLVIGTCLLVTFLSEVTSNTAITQVMLPILARVSQAMGVNPLLLMLPATISASSGFMLPVATPPNAIVFGSGHVEMGRMVRTGLILDFIGVVLVTGAFYLLARPLLGINPNAIPAWAQ